MGLKFNKILEESLNEAEKPQLNETLVAKNFKFRFVSIINLNLIIK